MVKTPRYLPDLTILAALMVLILLALVDWPLSEPTAAPTNDAAFTPLAHDPTAETVKRPTGTAVAGLFGYRAPAAVQPQARTTTAPVERPQDRLRYFGSVTTARGTAYNFKNMNTGQILTLYVGVENSQGWKLVSPAGDAYTIVHQGTVYKVPR